MLKSNQIFNLYLFSILETPMYVLGLSVALSNQRPTVDVRGSIRAQASHSTVNSTMASSVQPLSHQQIQQVYNSGTLQQQRALSVTGQFQQQFLRQQQTQQHHQQQLQQQKQQQQLNAGLTAHPQQIYVTKDMIRPQQAYNQHQYSGKQTTHQQVGRGDNHSPLSRNPSTGQYTHRRPVQHQQMAPPQTLPGMTF